MTEKQFDRVFSRAQDLRYESTTKKDIEKGDKLLAQYKMQSPNIEGTVTHLGMLLNYVAMYMDGEYDMTQLTVFRDYCLMNVKILPEKKRSVKKKKK